MVAILIVLEQGWKTFMCFDKRNSSVVAILIVLEQGWKAKATKATEKEAAKVAILIVLEQGWKLPHNPLSPRLWYNRRNPHCTGAGLEACYSLARYTYIYSRNPHCTGAGLEERRTG